MNTKHHIRAALQAALYLLVLATAIHTAVGGEQEDTAKALAANGVAAMGGNDAARGWTTRVDSGLLTAIWPGWGELRAECTRFVMKPDKMKLDQDFSAFDHPFFFTYYYNGGEAWMMVNLGVRQNPRYTAELGAEMKTIDGLAYYLAECDTFFALQEIESDSLLAGASFDRIGVVDNGDTVLFDLNSATHLPMRRIDQSGARHVLFDDYRSTGNMKVPFHVTIYENGTRSSDYVWEKISFEAEIDDAIFEEYRPPATQKPN